MENTKRIIEINGVKMEVDLRDAKVIDNYKVGDNVKILVENYSNDYKSYLGKIVGFDQFENMPTIIVAYLEDNYGSCEFKFAYINSGTSKKYELCPVNDWDVPYSKSDIIDKIDRKIEEAEEKLREVKERKNYFLKAFGNYFENKENKIKGTKI